MEIIEELQWPKTRCEIHLAEKRWTRVRKIDKSTVVHVWVLGGHGAILVLLPYQQLWGYTHQNGFYCWDSFALEIIDLVQT